MAVYRYQVVSVGWWRGKIKRWNTTFHMTQSNQTPAIYSRMQATGYPNPGDVTGDCSGGVASISVYDAAGGAPIVVTTYFDWQTPTTWIPYTGSVWSNIAPDTPLDASGESAMLVVGNMAALSATGKPVTTRKFFHAIPSRTAVDFADPDIDAATIALVEAQWGAVFMGTPAGVQPATVTVEPYYGNHQRVRGRRRTTRSVATDAFAGGVAIGASSSVGGGGAPAQFQ